ncbi:MAG: ornithine--oxo-acid transaminase [Sphingobacteriales bacterium]|nr:MAG: ornithine--oxo-acid transaminase [Sphingobacteriales bacterium]
MTTAQANTNTSAHFIELEDKFGAHNYKPLPVVLERASGVFMWDVEGKRYYDFLAAYSAVNQGHCHPRLVKVMQEQAEKLTLTSRAFYNNKLGEAERVLTEKFGYDKALLMNGGVEAVESAMKLARRWGYVKKGIPENEAVIVCAANNFHGRTLAVVSLSTDRSARNNFGPFIKGIFLVPFNDLESLDKALSNPNVCAYLVEPIQGEAGVILPDDGYLKGAQEICKKHNVLFITDEIQSGLCRTGKMLAQHYEAGVHADVLILGKALSGGMMPISAVLANDEVMLTINPGEHGSTFGGNPLAAAIAVEALHILEEENLAENAAKTGEIFRNYLREMQHPLIRIIRGKGLFNAIQIYDENNHDAAYDICKIMMKNGLLAKQTHGNVIRFAPPLCITEEQMLDCCEIIKSSINQYAESLK